MPLTDNSNNAIEGKLIKQTLHGQVAECKDFELFGFPVGIVVLVGGLNR
jgi:hypothetical protein